MSAPVNVPLNPRGRLVSSLPAEQLAEITELFDFRRVGYSLDAPFYTAPAIFTLLALLFVFLLLLLIGRVARGTGKARS